MICLRCGSNVADGAKFCGDCGSPLPWKCRDCGSENPPTKRFCGECGAALTAELGASRKPDKDGPPPTAERRQLTVMFADLVGSTALGARLDTEDVREVIAAYHGCVTGLAVRLGGFVGRYVGDGVLIYFGYPQANEDDAERAIHAGLAVIDAISRLGTAAGPSGTLKARVGIATGVVLVGDLIGFGSSLESSVVGNAANLAARLQALAEPGMVVIDETTHLLTGGLFDYRDLGPSDLKGLSASVRIWAVLGESAFESRFEALRSNQVALVGRAEEAALLVRRWEQAKNGEGRVVLLSGEPGIGKSRLIAALQQKLSNTPNVRLRFICSPHDQDTPLHPFIRYLGRAADFRPDDAPAAKRDKLARLLASATSSELDILVFADLLSIAGAADDLPKGMTPRMRKEATFAALLRHVGSLAKQSPLLVAFEDIHWADPSTRELLDILIETVEQLPILLVITTRPDLQPSWATRPHVTVQLLSSLGRRDATSMIKEVAGEHDLPAHVVDRIMMRADGVPLFIEELTKTVLESGRLGKDRDELSPTDLLFGDVVPVSLQASMMARLDRLADSKEVAQVGSVIGREFSFGMLQRLSELPVQRLEHALAQLEGTGLASRRGQPPESAYIFKHALVQDAAYASLLRDRRRVLHLRLAEMLSNDPAAAASTEPQLIAWHFGEAGARERSIEFYLKAAERATGRFALAEIVNHLNKGLRQAEYLPESPSKLQRELDLQVALGHALIDHKGSGSEEVRTAFERGRELCLALGDIKQLVVVFDGLVLNHHFAHSEPAKMLRYTTELLEIAQRTGDPLALLWARRARGSANLLQGHFEEARAEMELVAEMYESRQDGSEDRLMARDPRASTYTLLGICLTALGYPDSGAARNLEGLRHAELVNHVASMNTGLRRACVQGIMRRDTDAVLDTADRLLVLNTKHETFVGTREGTIFHGWAQLRRGWDAAIHDRVLACLDQLEAAKHRVMLPFFMTAIAEVIGEHGDQKGAVVLLNRAAEVVEHTGERWCEAEITRLKVRFGRQDAEAAIVLLRSNLKRTREQSAKLWELRTATQLARLWQAQNKPALALEILAPICGWFTEGQNAPDLVDARTLLSNLKPQ